jgi:hypothetical protein
MRLQISIVLFMAVSGGQAMCQQASVLPSAPKPASLQRIEVGAVYNNLGLSPCKVVADCAPIPPHNLFGPGVAINLSQHWAIDASYDATTGYLTYPYAGQDYYPNGSVAGGRGSRALAGGRFNLRASRYSFFAYGKAGAVLWSRIYSEVDQPGPFAPSSFSYGTHAYFAVGAGAGVEYSPSPRVHVRASVGDLVVDYGLARLGGCTDCFAGYGGYGTAWDHNSDVNVGVFVGMGRSMPVRPTIRVNEKSHRFFDKTNFALLGVDLLAQTADAIGTQHFIKNGFEEQDGLARPFVNQGWPGQITAMALGTTAEVLVMYGLHRMGHHRLEHCLPLAATVPSAYAGYQNLKNWDYYDGH